MDSLRVHTCIASASSFAILVGITKGGVVLAQASAFSCVFMQLMIACCSRVRSAPFVALAICKVFLNSTALMFHAWCHGRCPVLVLPREQGHFPMMDAGGSPFPHKEGASVEAVLQLRLVPQALVRPAPLTQQGGALYGAPAPWVQCRGAQVVPLMEHPAPLYSCTVVSSSFC